MSSRFLLCSLLTALPLASANDPAGSWLSYAEFRASGTVTMVNTTWVVPDKPKRLFGSNAPGWWYGIQTAKGDGALIQPILAYGYRDPTGYSMFNACFDWTDGSWTTSDETYTVQPGDTMISSVVYKPDDNSYDMYIESKDTGKSILTNYKLEERQTEPETVVYFVLEHQPETCGAYPSDGVCTFENIHVEVDHKAVPASELTWSAKQEQPACNSEATIVDSQTIKFTWDASSSSVSTPLAKENRKWAPQGSSLSAQFDLWKADHGKVYGSEEEHRRRLEIFRENSLIAEQHNAAAKVDPMVTYSLGVTGPFADLTEEEFASKYLMSSPQNCSATHKGSGSLASLLALENRSAHPTPESVDWRTKGVVTPIKSQGQCGSCWTFSTTGCLEAHTCIKEKRDCTGWSGLAEQQLVDCAGAFNNHGCNGGLPSQAYEYIHYNGGIDTEESYDYTAKDGKCSFDAKHVGATVRGVHNVTSGDEDEIVKAVAEFGPVSIAYQVASDFRLYTNGVYNSYNATTKKPICGSAPSDVNHAVVVVGYGTAMDDSSTPYYIIRNSWGNTWGMEGYFWMIRGKNMCGIADCASFPLV